MLFRKLIFSLVLVSIFLLPASANAADVGYKVQVGDEMTYKLNDYYDDYYGKNNANATQFINPFPLENGTKHDFTFKVGDTWTIKVCSVPEVNLSTRLTFPETKLIKDGLATKCEIDDYRIKTVRDNKTSLQNYANSNNGTEFDGNILTRVQQSEQNYNGEPLHFQRISWDMNTGWLTKIYRKDLNQAGEITHLEDISAISSSIPGFEFSNLIIFFIFVTSIFPLLRRNNSFRRSKK